MILNTSQPLCVNEILRSQYKKRHFWKIIQKNVQALLSGEKKKKKKAGHKAERGVCVPRGWGFCPKVCARAPAPGAHSGLQREAQKEEGANARRTAVGGKLGNARRKVTKPSAKMENAGSLQVRGSEAVFRECSTVSAVSSMSRKRKTKTRRSSTVEALGK